MLCYSQQALMLALQPYAGFYIVRDFHGRNYHSELYNRMMSFEHNFQSDIYLFEPHMFIFIDETGSDKRTALRKFGYSFKGMQAVTEATDKGKAVFDYCSYVYGWNN